MNTPDPFFDEIETLCHNTDVVGDEFFDRVRAILARVRAEAMEEAAKIADAEAKRLDGFEQGWSCGHARYCRKCAVNIRSAAARILEESRGWPVPLLD